MVRRIGGSFTRLWSPLMEDLRSSFLYVAFSVRSVLVAKFYCQSRGSVILLQSSVLKDKLTPSPPRVRGNLVESGRGQTYTEFKIFQILTRCLFLLLARFVKYTRRLFSVTKSWRNKKKKKERKHRNKKEIVKEKNDETILVSLATLDVDSPAIGRGRVPVVFNLIVHDSHRA